MTELVSTTTIVIKYVTSFTVAEGDYGAYNLHIWVVGQALPFMFNFNNKKEPSDIANHIKCLINAGEDRAMRTIEISRHA